jgi:hypothetical protein
VHWQQVVDLLDWYIPRIQDGCLGRKLGGGCPRDRLREDPGRPNARLPVRASGRSVGEDEMTAACMRWSAGRVQSWRRPEDGSFDTIRYGV